MKKDKFEGVIVPVVTPFRNEDFGVDVNKLKLLIDYLIDRQQVDALIALGTTGEVTSLSSDEKKEIIHTVVSKVSNRVPVIIGTGSANLDDTISLTNFAEESGADGVLIVAPYYIRPDQEGLYQYFKAIANKTHLPIILYNIPSRAAVSMNVDTVLRMAQIDKIVGIKDCCGSIEGSTELIMRCRSELKKDFSILTGEDINAFINLALGGDGAIVATGHIIGKQLKSMIAAYKEKDIPTARNIQFSIWRIQKLLFSLPNPVLIKAALDLAGLDLGGPVRLPLVSRVSIELESLLAAELKTLGLCDG